MSKGSASAALRARRLSLCAKKGGKRGKWFCVGRGGTGGGTEGGSVGRALVREGIVEAMAGGKVMDNIGKGEEEGEEMVVNMSL